jgi:6-methylsalicylate decarboxylase
MSLAWILVNRFTEPVHRLVHEAIDIHQHFWPEPLLGELSRRRSEPMLVRRAAGWVLRLRGEPEAPVDLGDHDLERRAALVEADGLERALVAPSVPLGIEALPADEAQPLLDAYHDGVAALGPRFGAWAAVGLAEPDPSALARLLDRGFAGACIAADALGDPAGFDRLGAVLETLEGRDAPLLVHPGPAPAGAVTGMPGWWPALTHYVAGMQTAWHAFAAWGRPAHPRLRVCFAMLAGLAPLQRERLVARGGPAVSDAGVFLEVSSYGGRAVDAMLREVGVDRLVHGSDRPVGSPSDLPFGEAVGTALRERNPSRLLLPAVVAA